MLYMTDIIRNNANVNINSVVVSLDLTKAFNSISHVYLVHKLNSEFNFSATACRLVESYLHDRSQFVVLNGKSSNVLSLTCGVPQGSVLGPLLFVLYVNSLKECFSDLNCKLLLFADDVFLVFSNVYDSQILFETEINDCLARFEQWCFDNMLVTNPVKTRAICFGNFSSQLNIFLNRDRVAIVNCHKILGLFVDDKLLFDTHVDFVQRKVYSIIRRLYSTNLSLPIWVKRKIAYALLMPHIYYGLEVMSGTIERVSLKLKRVVNSITRFVFGVRLGQHISDYVDIFLGINFERFVNCRVLCSFYKIVKTGVPALLKNMFRFAMSSRNTQIFIPRIYNSTFERSFVIRVARLWNYLPTELRIFSPSNNAFRLKLIGHLRNSDLHII